MRSILLSLVIATLFNPHLAAAQPVTVARLEQIVADAHSHADKDVAKQLRTLELTERLSTVHLTRMLAQLTGTQPRNALLAVADASAFLDLPAADILPLPAPDRATQGRLLNQTAQFVSAAVSKMPDFFADRLTTRFENLEQMRWSPEPVFLPYQSLLDKTDVIVQYRNGREVVAAPEHGKHSQYVASNVGLEEWGVFGPMLAVVTDDMLHGKIGWGHWEQGASGPVAVFRYAIPEDRSNYTVHYCCFLGPDRMMRQYETVPQYHGEISIDPATGAVLRLVVKTDLQEAVPIFRADVIVEYGPVEIGGRSYICPVKSISIVTATAVFTQGFGKYLDMEPDGNTHPTTDKFKATAINDMVFDHYHEFRGEMRILPEQESDPAGNQPVPPAVPPPQP